MNSQEILTAAIRKAWEEGGYNKNSYLNTRQSAIEIIFAKDFAKAFWGDEFANCDRCGAPTVQECNCHDAGLIDRWRYHQHKMLDELQEGRSPVKYLEQFLK